MATRLAAFITALVLVLCTTALRAGASDILIPSPGRTADRALPPLQVVPKLSTLGQVTELRLDLNRYWKLRVETSELSEQFTRTENDIAVRSRLTMFATSLYFDWHPFAGSFRTSAGIVSNYNDVSASAQHQGSYSYNGTTLYARDLGMLTADARFGRQAPYFGIGWGNNHASGRSALIYSLDVGALQLRDPKVNVGMPGLLGDTVKTNAPQEYHAWRSAEEQSAEQQLGHIRYFPLLSFGLVYAF